MKKNKNDNGVKDDNDKDLYDKITLASLTLFALLWMQANYTDKEIYYYIGFIPMIYGVLRWLARILGQ